MGEKDILDFSLNLNQAVLENLIVEPAQDVQFGYFVDKYGHWWYKDKDGTAIEVDPNIKRDLNGWTI